MCGHRCSAPLLDQVPASLAPGLDCKVMGFLVYAHGFSHSPQHCTLSYVLSLTPGWFSSVLGSSLWTYVGPFPRAVLVRVTPSSNLSSGFGGSIPSVPSPNPSHFLANWLSSLGFFLWKIFRNGGLQRDNSPRTLGAYSPYFSCVRGVLWWLLAKHRSVPRRLHLHLSS